MKYDWFVVLVLFRLVDETTGSHFRGAIISWKPSGKYEKEILVTYRVSWRRSYDSSVRCTDDDIESKKILSGEGGLLLSQPSRSRSSSVTAASFICTDYNTNEDWSTGEKSNIAVNVTDSTFSLGFSGNAWISLVVGGGGRWEVWTKGNITQRADNGRINSSPVTNTAPILRIQQHCFHIVKLRVNDPDNDFIKCRFARGTTECGSICNGLPGAILDERTCVLSYNATGRAGMYGVAIQVEDFANLLDVTPMSSVALQFLFNVFVSSKNCETQPRFSQITRADSSCVGVPWNATFKERIYATTGSAEDIGSFSTSSPQGLLKSKVFKVLRNETIPLLEPLPATAFWYYIEVTWTPILSQSGEAIFCYAAVATSQTTTEQRCITLVAGTTPPTIIDMKPKPNTVILPTTDTWVLQFDRQFIRPTRPTFFRIYRMDEKLVYNLDVSSSRDYEILADNTVRIKTPGTTLQEKEKYFVAFDRGLVKGLTLCGAESEAIFETHSWNVTIKDVTAPVLTFVKNEPLTNSNISIKWTYNENATSKCILKTPAAVISVNCSTDGWIGESYAEGTYTLWAYGTDESSNTGLSGTHTWRVDTTPPEIKLQIHPSLLSNKKLVTITFGCVNEITCTSQCRLLRGDNVIISTADCSSNRFVINNPSLLKSGERYTFEVVATDTVGNKAAPWSWSWNTDFDAPILSSVVNRTVSCGDSLSPSDIGLATATDTLDRNPVVTYVDTDDAGCVLLRTWTAHDAAGNEAHLKQFIHLIAVTSIRVNMKPTMLIPCTNNLQRDVDIKELMSSGLVIHPCNRTMSASFIDNPPLQRCDSVTTRRYTFSDDCGQSIDFQQIVKVLPIQEPLYPKVGQLNVDLRATLKWPTYPNSGSYELYVWTFGKTKNKSVTLNSNSYTPNTKDAFKPDTKMAWQVEYVLKETHQVNNLSIVPSPIWGFTTVQVPDFKVITVSEPLEFFTGRTVQVSWTVRNVGTRGNFASSWYDRVFLSKDVNSNSGLLTATVRRQGFMFANDGYTSKATLSIPNDMAIGKYYIIVLCDIYRYVKDYDRTNNRATSIQPVTIKLTPPPDLRVEQIIIPTRSFSGLIIDVRWTVKNHGFGVTSLSDWVDRIYWSQNFTTDASPKQIGLLRHSGILFPLDQYESIITAEVPKFIYGDFFIGVRVDAGNVVFEHVSEDNNFLISERIQVTLTPPPDLIVTEVLIPANVQTKDKFKVTYNVENIGSGPTDNVWWYDRVRISSVSSSLIHMMSSPPHSGSLDIGSTYVNEVHFTVPETWNSDNYTVTVTTDIYGNVFEFDKVDNNALTNFIQVTQSLPDLAIKSFNLSSQPQQLLDKIHVSFLITLVNQGKLDITDIFSNYIVMEFPSGLEQNLYSRRITSNVKVGGTFSYEQNITIYRQRILSAKFKFKVDVFGNIYESNEQNNVASTGFISLPSILDDVQIRIMGVLDPNTGQVTGEVFSGEEFVIRIRYENKKIYTTTSTFTDQLFLKFLDRTYLLQLFEISIIPGEETKTVNLTTTVPTGLFGDGMLLLKHDTQHSLLKPKLEATEIRQSINIQLPPTADLKPKSFTAYLQEGRVPSIKAIWNVENIGNHMRKQLSWNDDVILSRSNTDPYASDWLLIGRFDFSSKLQTDQTYTQNKDIIIPPQATGAYFVHLIVDAGNIVPESNGETNNNMVKNEEIVIPMPQRPDLSVKIDLLSPISLTAGETVMLQYTVYNTGQITQVSSWSDKVMMLQTNQQNSITVFSSRHIGELGTNNTYTIGVAIFIPVYLTGGLYQLKVITDNSNKVIETSETNNDALSNHLNVSAALQVDLEIGTTLRNISAVAGQPLQILYHVVNLGPGSLSNLFPWYDSLYLSEDAALDVFDVKLCVNKQQLPLLMNISYNSSFDCSLPFFLPGSLYYLLLKVNDGNLVRESTETNNIISILLKNVGTTLTSDLAVVDIEAPDSVQYGQSFTSKWKIMNNGTEQVSGYKCDSVYLSANKRWDITDSELTTTCSFISLENKFSSNNKMAYSITKPLPLVKQANYYSIVKTRSNIIDYNLINNDAFTTSTTFVTHANLTWNIENKIPLDKSVVLRVADVPSGESLIITASSSDPLKMIELYVRYKEPADIGVFDVFAGEFLSSSQKAVVKNTRKGDYYVTVTSSDQLQLKTQTTLTLLSKIAKFEITDVNPKSSSPLYPHTTFKIEGVLFPSDYTVYFVKKSDQNFRVVPLHSYRFSSTLLYSTVTMSEFNYGDLVSIEIIDDVTSEKAVLVDAVEVAGEEIGSLTTRINAPRAVRAGETVELSIDTQNVGGSDVLPPILIIDITGTAVFTLVQGNKTIRANTFMLFAAPLEGPAGILPPGKASRIDLTMSQPENLLTSVPISVRQLSIKENQKHPYVDKIDLFRPMLLEDRRWGPVWKVFLQHVGTSIYSLHKRLSLTSNQLGLIGKRIYEVDELIKLELDLADGFHIGKDIHRVVDVQADGDNYPFISIERYINPKLTFRDIPGSFNGFGPFGRGWISPFWSASLRNITLAYIILEKEYDYFTFVSDETETTFINPDGLGKITHNETTGHYIFEKLDQSPSVKYIFHKDSGYKVIEVRSVDDKTKITVDHDNAEVYDNYGNKIKLTYGNNRFVKETKLLKNDQLISSVTYTYNELNYLTQVTKDEKYITKYEYDIINKALIKVTNHDKSWTRYTYDQEGLYSGLSHYTAQNSLLRSALYTMTAPGELDMVEQPGNRHSKMRYDLQGKLVYVKNKGSPSYHFVRNENDDTILLDDLTLATEKYDVASRIKTITNAEGVTTKLYLAENNISVKELHDGNKNIYMASYDDNSNLIQSTFPDQKYETYSYDKDNFLVETTRRSGKKISFARDKDGFMFEKKTTSGLKTTFEYNNDGLLSKASTSTSTVELKYDDKRRPVSVTYDTKRSLLYTYDSYGRRKSIADSTGQYNVTYQYDHLGRIVNVLKSGNNVILSMTYKNGKVVSRQTGNGHSTDYKFGIKTNKLEKIQFHKKDKTNPTMEISYTYDRFARIKNITTGGEIWQLGYDSISQMTSFKDKNGATTEFEYDDGLNRKSKTKSDVKSVYTINNMNQVNKIGSDEFVYYDDDGNLVRIENLKEKKEQRFEYNTDKKLTSSVNEGVACSYQYDALGNIQKETCGGNSVEYLIDPFGIFGTDIVGKYSAGNISFFYYGMEQGLISKQNLHENETYYFQFDHVGSTIQVANTNGDTVNSYKYDPFGIIIHKSELDANEFLYVGQWGVRKVPGFTELYDMRNRIYHAGYGRFMNLDPYGFSGKSTNMYCYMANNPIAGNDPRGTIVPAIIGGAAVIGAVVNTGWYIASNINSFGDMKAGDIAAGIAGAAVGGASLGAGTALVATLLPVTGVASVSAMVGVGAGSAGLGNAVEQLFDSKSGFDVGSFVETSIIGALTANIPLNLIGFKGQGFSAFGNAKNKLIRNIKLKNLLKGLNAHGKTLWKTLTTGVAIGGTLDKIYKTIKDKYGETIKKLPEKAKKAWDDFKKITKDAAKRAWDGAKDLYEKGKELAKDIEGYIKNKLNDLKDAAKELYDDLKDKLNDAKDKVSDWIDETQKFIKDFADKMKDGAKDLWDGLAEWIRSIDPNDIIGPAGFGDARFIAIDTLMNYKIRFENDVNATAPAQKVTISSTLDKDLDFRTFRIGPLGFGNFTYNPEKLSSILQTKVDLVSTLSFYIRVVAGIDVITGMITFEIEALDPETGQRPANPRIGFLPPNPVNGTDGQGFVTYSIRPKKNIPNLSVIDAEAEIVFDQNEAISTPPIFNTIDSSIPLVNISLSNGLGNASSSTIISLSKFDNGSGVKYVDVYQNNSIGILELLVEGVTAQVVALPLRDGQMYDVFAVAVDNVGNKAPIHNAELLNIFVPEVTCYAVNNCSRFGNCTGLDLCSCLSGRYGSDCNSTTKPLEPPIAESSETQIKNVNGSFPLNIYVKRSDDALTTSLTVIIHNIPEEVDLSTGRRNGSYAVIGENELTNLSVIIKQQIPSFTLEIVAQQKNLAGDIRSRTSFAKIVMPLIKPVLFAQSTCIPEGNNSVVLSITANAISVNGGILTVFIKPGLWNVSIVGISPDINGTYTIPGFPGTETVELLLWGITSAFNLSIAASYKVANTTDYSEAEMSLLVRRCMNIPTTVSTTKSIVPKDDKDDKTGMYTIIGVVAGVTVLVIIIIVVVSKVKQGRRRNQGKETEMSTF